MAKSQYLTYFALLVIAATVVYSQVAVEPVNEVCLGCICEAISNCNRSLTCTGDVCGLFRITWAYWSDAGKPVLQGDSPDSQGAYSRCTVDPYCAATTVQQYMGKYAQDCNGDNRINCLDYSRIHRLGGYGCNAQLDPLYSNKFDNCWAFVTNNKG